MITYNGKILKYGTKWVKSGAAPAPSGAVIGGKTYPTVVMPDGSTWLAVNLDYAWTGLSVPTSGATQSTDPQAMYYDYDESTYGWNGYKCGLLYNWYAVDYLEQHKATLCPGWHVPSTEEWNALATAVGGASTAGTKLKASDVSWASSWVGTDDYGFAALPAGYSDGMFYSVGSGAFFWSATEVNSWNARYRSFGSTVAQISSNYNFKEYQYSVRLVKDS